MSKCSLGNLGADVIADLLDHSSEPDKQRSLRILSLASNNVTHIGAESLCDALLNNKTLKDLDLSNNELGDQGAVCFSKILSGKAEHSSVSGFNSGLRKLNLAGNSIGKDGVRSLITALKTNNTIEELKYIS